MKKGKNGPQVAVENIEAVRAWIDERNRRRDWSEYSYSNRINRSTLAEELDIPRCSFTQNDTIRSLLEDSDRLWFKSEAVDKVAHEAARERAELKSSRVSSDNSELIRRLAELETENRQLRRELDAYKRQQALVERGAAGFKL